MIKISPLGPMACNRPAGNAPMANAALFSRLQGQTDRLDLTRHRPAPLQPRFGNNPATGAVQPPVFPPRNIGDSASDTVTITRQMVLDYANLLGDKNPIHVDEATGKASIFGTNIAHGMLVGGLFGPIIVNQLIGQGAVYVEQTLKFTAPVAVDETVTGQVTVTAVKRKPDKDIYILDTQVLLPDGKPAITGQAVIIKPTDTAA